MKTPCMNCADRTISCHSNCERYEQYRLENYEMKKRAKQERALNQIAYNGRRNIKLRNSTAKWGGRK